MTVSRSEIRKLREAAGLSRAKLAELAQTTPHYVWVAEMPPYGHLPSEVLDRLVGVLTEGSPAPGSGSSRGRGVSWVCPECGYKETQPKGASGVMHRCPRKGRMVALRLDVRSQEK